MFTDSENPHSIPKHYKYIYGLVAVIFAIFLMTGRYQENFSGKIELKLYYVFYGLYFLSPVSYFFRRSYQDMSWCTYLLCSFLGVYILYLAGGFYAPGVFWLTSIPVLAAGLLDREKLHSGIIILIVAIILYGLSHYFGHTYSYIKSEQDYFHHRTINLLLYFIFSSVVTYAYIRKTEVNEKVLEGKRTQIENLLRIIIHDISGPLMTSSIRLNKIMKDNPSEKIRNGLDPLKISLNNIQELLSQVKEYKAVSFAPTEQALERIDIEKSIFNVIAVFKDRALLKNISLVHDICLDEKFILANKVNFEMQILSNLLTNALKFSEEGGKILITAKSLEAQIIVSVKDFGIGIPENILTCIYDMESSTTRKGTSGEKGTGYGLPIVKSYLEHLGGEIDIQSFEKSLHPESHGTKVTLTFPAA